MGIYALLNSINSTVPNTIQFICPSCGENCNVGHEKCPSCSYDLKHYKKIIFSHYVFFNNCIEQYQNGSLFQALISIVKYLAYEPDDVEANKLYIYLLHKNGKEEDCADELEKFEHSFPRHSWLMEIHRYGLDSFTMPEKKDFVIESVSKSLSILEEEYTSNRIKATNDILEFAVSFYDLIRTISSSTNRTSKQVLTFYNKKFLQFLSKREICFESYDGRNIDELTREEYAMMEIIAQVADKHKTNGTIVVIQPAIKVRSRIVVRQKVMCVNNSINKKTSARTKQ